MSESSDIILIKYGGNAMLDPELQKQVVSALAELHAQDLRIILVHGGGPEINKLLKLAMIESEFVGGQRKTTAEAMMYVQMALRGQVNGTLVRLLNNAGAPAVGLSGKDGNMVIAEKRFQEVYVNGKPEQADIGFVGNIKEIDTKLMYTLIENRYLPVVAPLAVGKDGMDYNINADIFAGKLAAALKAKAYVSLTDVDGLYYDIHNPDSRIPIATLSELKQFIKDIATGGMLPKLESIAVALQGGVKEAHIFNGTKPDGLKQQLLGKSTSGTKITVEPEPKCLE